MTEFENSRLAKGPTGWVHRAPSDCTAVSVDDPGEVGSRRAQIVRLVQEEVEALFRCLEDRSDHLDAAIDDLFAEIDAYRYGPR